MVSAVGKFAAVGYEVLFTRYVSIAVRNTESDCSVPLILAESDWPTNFGNATVAKIPRIKTTTINSIRVKARLHLREFLIAVNIVVTFTKQGKSLRSKVGREFGLPLVIKPRLWLTAVKSAEASA